MPISEPCDVKLSEDLSVVAAEGEAPFPEGCFDGADVPVVDVPVAEWPAVASLGALPMAVFGSDWLFDDPEPEQPVHIVEQMQIAMIEAIRPNRCPKCSREHSDRPIGWGASMEEGIATSLTFGAVDWICCRMMVSPK